MPGRVFLSILLAHAAVDLPLARLASATQQQPASAAKTTAEKPWPPAGVVRPGAGVLAPRLLKDVKPRYSAEAMAAKVTGAVVMEAVVEADGTVGEIRIKRSLDREFGLDDEAVRTLKKWVFAPGTRDGIAVPVLVEVEMTFSLRK